MAASSLESEEDNNGKKRKRREPESSQKAGKVGRTDYTGETPNDSIHHGGVKAWKRLDLILLLQRKDLQLQRKIETAFEFVSSIDGSGKDHQGCFELVQMPRFIIFLNDWMQSVLITPDKKKSVNEGDVCLDPCLDFRCWTVFCFCLKSQFSESLSFSPKLLRSISHVIEGVSESAILGGKNELLSVVTESVSLLFSSSQIARIFNANVDSWASSAFAALEFVRKIFAGNLSGDIIGILIKLSSVLLESFSKFLRAHPNPKNVFPVVVEKLLEPLLSLLPVLMNVPSSDAIRCNCAGSLLKTVEDILSNGLFHTAHIDGFLNIRSAEKHLPFQVRSSMTRKVGHTAKEQKSFFKSYHNRLFEKLKQLRDENKSSALAGVGLLLSLFISRVKKQTRTLNQFKSTKTKEKPEFSGNLKRATLQVKTYQLEGSNKAHEISVDKESLVSEQGISSSRLDEAKTRLLFDLFVEFMAPLMSDVGSISETIFSEEAECSELLLSNIYCRLQAINKILCTFLHEKIYSRTEDTPEERHYNFLKEVYSTIISFAVRIPEVWLSLSKSLVNKKGPDDGNHTKMTSSITKEVIIALKYSLEIEYKVAENDLVTVWLLILSYLALDLSHSMLASEILSLGCQLINVYSDLRQVDNPIFALCKAMRLFTFHNDEGLKGTSTFLLQIHYLSTETRIRSVLTLLCSQEFRVAIYTATNSIAEGQVAGCLRHLKTDMEESFEWIKIGYLGVDKIGNIQNLLAELLGKGLSELYALILDSLTVTAGNSIPVGNSVKDLMAKMSPSLSVLVDTQSDNIDRFFFSVTGRRFSASECGVVWVVLFFLRLYTSCRSLYQQLICIMPPDSAKKASTAMGDLFTAFSGKDWMKRTNLGGEDYFSWIIKPSISLLVLIQSVSDTFLQDGSVDCVSLIYVFHLMAFQRLVDLNRQIKAFEFLQEKDARMLQGKSLDDADLHLFYTEKKKWKRLISLLRKEALDLTIFITQSIDFDVCGTQEYDGWDLSICSMSKSSLPTAIWWLLCRNLDIWCVHASKKSLKKFISILFYSSLPCLSGRFVGSSGYQSQVYMHGSSLELLSDTALYEQNFLCRHLMSRFCRILKGSLPSLLLCSSNCSDFDCLPDWSELISIVEKVCMVGINSGHTPLVVIEVPEQQQNFPSISRELLDCRSLLDLLCWMPKSFVDSRSFVVYAIHILNLERLIILCFLNYHGKLPSCKHYELLKLFLSCRRALKYLAVASNEELEVGHSSFIQVLFGSSFSILWLLKSVSTVAGLSCEFPEEEHTRKVKDLIFSLMDHTSHIFLTLSKGQFDIVVKSLLCKEPSAADLLEANDLDVWRSVEVLIESLKDETRNLHIALGGAVTKPKFEAAGISSLVSALQGILWGLAFALNNVDEKRHVTKTQPLQLGLCAPKLMLCVNVFEDFVKFCSNTLLVVSTLNPQVDVCTVDLFELPHLNKALLQTLLRGESLEIGFLLGQLFVASAALLKLKYLLSSPMTCSQLDSTSVGLLIGASQFLLSEFAEMVEPHESSFIWLEGVLKFLEVLGWCFPFSDPVSSRNTYSKLIDIHLKAIAKCILLQGKVETISADESEKISEKFPPQTKLSGKFKARVRMSLTTFIKKPLELHLLSAVQAIEKALVGVQEGCNMSYGITIGGLGGQVSTTVAAGVECLDLILESISGRKRLTVLARHIPNLAGALFNVILHLQSPRIFYRPKSDCHQNEGYADPGSVIYMCVDILTKVAGKNSQFPLDSCHVGQSLHLPAALYQYFNRLRTSQNGCCSLIFSANQGMGPLDFYSTGMHPGAIDRQFSVDLYTACCRLLCAVLRHRKRESGRCITLLQDSVRILLECLERMDANLPGATISFFWEVQEAVKCGSGLRRIYEEIRQQKDTLGRYAAHFLSNYISIYSGYGPLKTGFNREVDDALKPGVYALVDMCSPDDLQRLHTILGEGPCRSTLSALNHDYELNFKYGGKI